MQIARQTSSSEKPSTYFLLAAEKSENSEESLLIAVYYIRNFPIVQLPIRNKPIVFPMMTFVDNLHPAYLQQNFDAK
jgi:hypothetical protein